MKDKQKNLNAQPGVRKEFIKVAPNVRLHITDIGEGLPLVLIHGWPLSDAMYEYQYQYFVERGIRVIGITLRGFGKSSKPYGQYNYEVFAADIKTVLEKLEIKDAVLGGFSMGGAISIYFTSRYKGEHISKLALFGAAAPIWTQRPDFPFNVTQEAAQQLIDLSRVDRPKLYEDFGKIFTASEDSVSPGMGAWLNTINWEASPYAATQCLIALKDTDLRPQLAEVAIQTVIFHGRYDKICDFQLAEKMHESLKDSKLVPFEHSGHALFIEEAEKFNQELEEFILG
ncbi:alpha/beta hydrolase [Dyadobacter sp. LJ53]|uniref:alpha/beta fold hydrolase n=1 Tax=Dyadobacter chenwenxiniae TaxID=2906456 RepID=UPI001F4449B6|nr:alpha/beta hydrolase [Dyadobacter chenwenxiniae]MCF0048977.1 alpha/beta hydrolase [Dyadobacter chenwenxiniae]